MDPTLSRLPDSVEDSLSNGHGIGSDEVYFWVVFGFFFTIVLIVFLAPSK